MILKTRPCWMTRAGFLLCALLLSGCDINTDNLTFKNLGAGILRTMCRMQDRNCDVRDPT